MRTTLTLDDDVTAQLERLRTQQQRPFRELVNAALRAGLVVLDSDPPSSSGPYTSSVSLGEPLLPDLDDVSETLALVEGEGHR